MIPIFMLLGACYSDTTKHLGCNELQTANIKYYHLDLYGDNGKKFLESQVGKNVFIAATTIGYTMYKKELNYHVGNYAFKLTSSEGSASIKFGW